MKTTTYLVNPGTKTQLDLLRWYIPATYGEILAKAITLSPTNPYSGEYTPEKVSFTVYIPDATRILLTNLAVTHNLTIGAMFTILIDSYYQSQKRAIADYKRKLDALVELVSCSLHDLMTIQTVILASTIAARDISSSIRGLTKTQVSVAQRRKDYDLLKLAQIRQTY